MKLDRAAGFAQERANAAEDVENDSAVKCALESCDKKIEGGTDSMDQTYKHCSRQHIHADRMTDSQQQKQAARIIATMAVASQVGLTEATG
eukprot:8815537-Pyramimonas_sp.AAC.1